MKVRADSLAPFLRPENHFADCIQIYSTFFVTA